MSRHDSAPPSRRTAIIATVIVVALVAGVLLVRLGQGSRPSDDGNETPSAAEAPRPTVPAGVAGPAGDAAGVPVGFSADEPGAVAAAVAAGIVIRQIVEDLSDNVELWKSVTDEPLAD